MKKFSETLSEEKTYKPFLNGREIKIGDVLEQDEVTGAYHQHNFGIRYPRYRVDRFDAPNIICTDLDAKHGNCVAQQSEKCQWRKA